jgi:hypothetical protein
MDSRIKEALSNLQKAVEDEIEGLKKLEGERLKGFCDVFDLPDDSPIYYNEYNIVIINKAVHDTLEPFLDRKTLMLHFEAPESGWSIWSYQYINDQLFDQYLSDEYNGED